MGLKQNIVCLEYSLPYSLHNFQGHMMLELIQGIWQVVFHTTYVLLLYMWMQFVEGVGGYTSNIILNKKKYHKKKHLL